MNVLLKRFDGVFKEVITGFDRIVFKGMLLSLSFAEGAMAYLGRRGVLNKCFKEWATTSSGELCAAVDRYSMQAAGRPVEYLRTWRERKEELAHKRQNELGIETGLIGVWSCLETGRTFRAKFVPGSGRPVLVPYQTPCKHLLIYKRSLTMWNKTIIFLALTAFSCYAQDNANLVKNGDFSQGCNNWYWDVEHGKASVSPCNGNIKMTRHCPKSFLRGFQDVDVQPGGLYEFSVRAKTEPHSRYRTWLIFRNQKGEFMSKDIIYIYQNQLSNDWVTSKKRINIPNDVTCLRINFGLEKLDSEGVASALFDNISLRMLKSGEKQLKISVPYFKTKIELDGDMKENFWKKSPILNNFKILGKPSEMAKKKTEVRLAIVKNNLLIGIKAYDDMSKVHSIYKRNCFNIFYDENIEIFLCSDKFNADRDYIHLAVNPDGFTATERKGGNSKQLLSWWGSAGNDNMVAWTCKAKKHAEFWSVEACIPLAEIYKNKKNLNGKIKLYGNFCRHQSIVKNPHSTWAGIPGKSFHVPSFFPEIILNITEEINIQQQHNNTPNLRFSKKMDIPKILTMGKPVKLIKSGDKIPLPRCITFDLKGVALDAGLKKQIEEIMSVPNGVTWQLVCSIFNKDDLNTLSISEKEKMACSEAFCISVMKNKIMIKGRSQHGVLRGLATLVMIVKNEKYKGKSTIPCVKIWDAPGLRMRGWLITGRNPQQLKPQIDILYLLRFNTVQFEITTYGEKTLFPFETIPEIGSKTTTKKQWQELVKYAKARGICVVPIFYSWNRGGYILNRDKYAHLAERPELRKGSRSQKKHDRNFCAANPKSYELIFKLYEELIKGLEINNIHIGLDEIHFDDISVSKQAEALKRDKKDWIVDVITKTNDFCRKKGVRLWVFGDMFAPGMNGRHLRIFTEKDFLALPIPKDIIVQDWRYEVGPYPTIEMLKSAGYTTVGSSWYSIPATADMIRELYRLGCAGWVGVSWSDTVPWAILPELATAIPLGSYLSWSPERSSIKNISAPPGYFYQLARVHYSQLMPGNKKVVQLKTADNLKSGVELVNAFGGLEGRKLDFLTKKTSSAKGVVITPFMVDNTPAGIVVKGAKKKKGSVPLNGNAEEIYFLHTNNAQNYCSKSNVAMQDLAKKYNNKIAGKYIVRYTDGTQKEILLRCRKQITGWNDVCQATETELGLFGTLAEQFHVNISVMRWKNPCPHKEIKCIELQSGEMEDVDIILLGISLIR